MNDTMRIVYNWMLANNINGVYQYDDQIAISIPVHIGQIAPMIIIDYDSSTSVKVSSLPVHGSREGVIIDLTKEDSLDGLMKLIEESAQIYNTWAEGYNKFGHACINGWNRAANRTVLPMWKVRPLKGHDSNMSSEV